MCYFFIIRVRIMDYSSIFNEVDRLKKEFGRQTSAKQIIELLLPIFQADAEREHINPNVLCLLTQASKRLKNFDLALECAEVAYQQNLTSFIFIREYVQAYEALGQFEKAKEILNSSSVLKEDNVVSLGLMKASLSQKQGNFNEAITYLKNLVRQGYISDSYTKPGVIYYKLGSFHQQNHDDMSEIISCFEKAYQADPDAVGNKFNLSIHCYLYANQLDGIDKDKAFSLRKRALSILESCPEKVRKNEKNKIEILRRYVTGESRIQMALDDARSVEKMSGHSGVISFLSKKIEKEGMNFPVFLNTVAHYALGIDDLDKAEKYLTQSKKVDPDNPQTLEKFVHLHLKKGDVQNTFEASKCAYSGGLEKSPFTTFVLAVGLFMKEKKQEAVNTLEPILRDLVEIPDRVVSHANIVSFYAVLRQDRASLSDTIKIFTREENEISMLENKAREMQRYLVHKGTSLNENDVHPYKKNAFWEHVGTSVPVNKNADRVAGYHKNYNF